MATPKTVLNNQTGLYNFVISTVQGGSSNHPALSITIEPVPANKGDCVFLIDSNNGDVYEGRGHYVEGSIEGIPNSNSGVPEDAPIPIKGIKHWRKIS